MGAPKKYEREFVERAVRLYRDRLAVPRSTGADSKAPGSDLEGHQSELATGAMARAYMSADPVEFVLTSR